MRNLLAAILITAPLALFSSEVGTYDLKFSPDGIAYVINTKNGEVMKYNKDLKFTHSDDLNIYGGFENLYYPHLIQEKNGIVKIPQMIPQK